MSIGCFPLLWGNNIHLLSWLWQWLAVVRAPTLGLKSLLKLLLHKKEKSLLEKHHKFKSFLDLHLNFWSFLNWRKHYVHEASTALGSQAGWQFLLLLPHRDKRQEKELRSPMKRQTLYLHSSRDSSELCKNTSLLMRQKIMTGVGLLLRSLTAWQPGYSQV